MYFHKTELSTMTAVWLLPIVSTIVAAASGGIVAEVLPNPQHALWTVRHHAVNVDRQMH